MRVLDKTEHNLLVQFDNGEVDMVSLSPRNRLIYEHGLFGLLKEGTETVQYGSGEERLTVVPMNDATAFRLKYVYPTGETEIEVTEQHKPELIDALLSYHKRESDDLSPLISLIEDIHERMVRKHVVDPFAEHPILADAVETRDDGWFIHDHLLLDYEADFYHPNTTSRTRSGGIVDAGSTHIAYDLRLPAVDDGQATLESFAGISEGDTELTQREFDFITKALWAVINAPEGL